MVRSSRHAGYRAWEHHLALVAAALWFAAQTKLEWERACRRDITIALEMGVAMLPALSTANLREADAGGVAGSAAHTARSSTISRRTIGKASALDWQSITATNRAD